jgi:hypothetical protein
MLSAVPVLPPSASNVGAEINVYFTNHGGLRVVESTYFMNHGGTEVRVEVGDVNGDDLEPIIAGSGMIEPAPRGPAELRLDLHFPGLAVPGGNPHLWRSRPGPSVTMVFAIGRNFRFDEATIDPEVPVRPPARSPYAKDRPAVGERVATTMMGLIFPRIPHRSFL